MKRILLALLFLPLFLLNCELDAETPNLNAPMGLTEINSSYVTSAGTMPDPNFNMSAGTRTIITAYHYDTKYIGNLPSGDPEAMQNCITIEFYGYNSEQGFNGYNVYAIEGASYTDENDAWNDFVAHLQFYQSAHNDASVSAPLYPVSPGTLVEPYYASVTGTSIAFSGAMTKIVVVFNQYNVYGTSNVTQITGGLTLWVAVTAVSLTEGSLNESLPSNVIQITT